MSTVPRRDALVGRDRELSSLNRALNAAIAGRGSLITIGGDAGIGKTTLVQQLADEASQLDAAVLIGYCYDLEITPPFGPWISMAQTAPDVGGHVSLLTALTGDQPAASGSASAIHDSFWTYLVSLSSRRPVLIILEDIHWADQASLDLLRAVGRRLAELPVLAIATYRDAELSASQPLYQMLHPIVRESRATRLGLRQLDAEALMQFAATRFDLSEDDLLRLVKHLVRYADGNPYFAEEILSALEADGVIQDAGTGWSLGPLDAFRVPSLLRQVIDRRLERVDDETRVLLQVAAVVGGEVPVDVWQAVAEMSDDSLSRVIEQALETRTMVEVGERPALRFRHALIREALYEQILLPRRRWWHAKTAEVLVGRSAPDPDAIAHHFTQAHDEDQAADWLIRAGRRAARSFSYQITIERLERALAMLDRPGREAEHAWLLCELIEAYRYSDAQRAVHYADRALDYAAEVGDMALKAAVLRSRAHIRGFLREDALAEVEESQILFESLSDEDRQRILTGPLGYTFSPGTYAQRIGFYGLYGKAFEIASDFLKQASPPALPAEIQEHAIAYRGVAIGAAGLGKVDEARNAFNRSTQLFIKLGNTIGAANSLDYEYTMVLHIYLPHLVTERRAYIDEIDRLFNQSPLIDRSTSPGSVRLLKALLLDGRWQDAADAALAMSSVDAVQVDCLTFLAELEWLRGHHDRAMSYVERLLPKGATEEPGSVFYDRLLILPRIAAEIELDRGNPSKAVAWIESLERRLAASDIAYGHATPAILRARLHVESGDPVAARHQAEDAFVRASNPRQPLALIDALRELGRVALSGDNHREAGEHFGQALAIAESCKAPYETAVTRLDIAELAIATGTDSGLDVLVQEVEDIAERLGARPLSQRAAVLRERIGALPAEGQRSPQQLSPREVDVLRLVARGFTDAEVAEQLFISPRTVSGHLQSVYNKLGVSSRTAAAAFAFEHRLIDAE